MGLSPKDGLQVLRAAYDDATRRLRVDAAINIDANEVSISAADGDNIAISDGVDTLAVNPDGSLNVNVSGTQQIEIDAADGDNIAIASQDGTKFLNIEPDGSINVNAVFSVPGSLDVKTANPGDIVSKIADATNPAQQLKVEADGSINVNAALSGTDIDIRDLSATQDNVAISDGTDTLAINTDGSINVQATNLDIRDLTFANDKVDVSGSSISVTGSLPLPTGAATEAKQDIGNTSLASIDSKLTNLEVNIDAFTSPNPDNVMLVGSLDGTKTGTKYGYVNNLRQQILASHDREQDITYADFGTVNQRITQIDYSSSTFVGYIARKTINYTLVGNRYRRDSIIWSIV